MGTPAMTTRGFAEKDFEEVASFFHRSVTIAHEVNAKVGRKTFHSVVFFIYLFFWPDEYVFVCNA